MLENFTLEKMKFMIGFTEIYDIVLFSLQKILIFVSNSVKVNIINRLRS